MRSRATIAGHPIHPMLVPIPIGAFFLALVGDVLHTATPEDPYWYEFSFTCIGVGLIAVLVAAAFGAVDYLGVRMSSRAFWIATWHALTNVFVALLYCVSFVVRRNDAAMEDGRWVVAMALAVAGFCLLGVSGWLGSKLAFEHRIGVIEPEADPPSRSDGFRVAS